LAPNYIPGEEHALARRSGRIAPKVQLSDDFEATWPGARSLATSCILNMMFLSSQLNAFAESLGKAYDLPSMPSFNVLTILEGAGEPLKPSTIAERMVVHRATVTGILDSLERRGLVTRDRDPSDGRMRLVRITPAGIKIVKELLPKIHQSERRWIDHLSVSQQRTFLKLLAILQNAAPVTPEGDSL
jgi:MarR family 2-MHQ and catechol resistance regulon transcriptional repressor